MKIYIISDHGSMAVRNSLLTYLYQAGYDVTEPTEQAVEVDNLITYTLRVVWEMLGSDDPQARTIIMCTGGQAGCMAANRLRGVRACVGFNHEAVRVSRREDDSNVLYLLTNHLNKDEIRIVAETWLSTPFSEAARYRRRLKSIDDI